MLLRRVGAPSFFPLHRIPLCKCNSFLIRSFTDRHLGCFHHLAIVNCAAMNIGVHRFFSVDVSGFLGYIPNNGNVNKRSKGSSIFSCLRKCFLIFIYLFLEREERREKEKESNITVWLPLLCPQMGTRTTTQACAPTGNWTASALVCRPALNPPSSISHGWGNSVLFSIVAAPVCVPMNNVLEFPFLYNFSNTCLLIWFWWPFRAVWSGISLWF